MIMAYLKYNISVRQNVMRKISKTLNPNSLPPVRNSNVGPSEYKYGFTSNSSVGLYSLHNVEFSILLFIVIRLKNKCYCCLFKLYTNITNIFNLYTS